MQLICAFILHIPKTKFLIMWLNLRIVLVAFGTNTYAISPEYMYLHKFLERLFVYMSRVIREPSFCICENKYGDQLCGNREADQCLCFCYLDSTIPSNTIPSHLQWLYSLVCVRPSQNLQRLFSDFATHIFSVNVIRNNFIRWCILRVTQQSRKHLDKILNVEEFMRRIFTVYHSNDPVARAITLR